jgi:hypothetical protein
MNLRNNNSRIRWRPAEAWKILSTKEEGIEILMRKKPDLTGKLQLLVFTIYTYIYVKGSLRRTRKL